MNYEIILKIEADKELGKLSNRERILVFKQFKKIASSPELGKLLGNKAGYDLSGCRNRLNLTLNMNVVKIRSSNV